MIEAALAKHLDSKLAIRNLIGTGAIFRSRVPSDFTESLCLVIERQSVDPFNDLLGEPEVAVTNIDVIAVAKEMTVAPKADRLAEAVRQQLSGFRGYWGNLFVYGCTRENVQDFASPPPEGSHIWGYQVSTEYRVTHEQAAISERGAT